MKKPSLVALTFVRLAPLLIVLSCTHAPTQSPPACVAQVRGLIDVGSGTSKLNLSEVAVCENEVRLIQVYDDQFSVALPLEAGKDANGAFKPDTLTAASKAMNEIKTHAFTVARLHNPSVREVYFSAVGTHATRTATNAEVLVERMRELEIPLLPITQEQEGEIGYWGALHSDANSCNSFLPDAASRPVVTVWDIGGGSTQLIERGAVALHIEKFQLGAESFKAKLAPGHPVKTCKSDGFTPNPMGKKGLRQAIQMANHLVQEGLSDQFDRQSSRCWLGIGGLHTKAVEAQVTKQFPHIQNCVCGKKTAIACKHTKGVYTEREVQCLADYLSAKNDCSEEIRGPYASTAVSNLALILGYMQQLHVEHVQVASVNMGNRLVTDRDWLKWQAVHLPH